MAGLTPHHPLDIASRETPINLGEAHAGMLIFLGGHLRPEYVPWTGVRQLGFDRPPAMYPPLREPRPSGCAVCPKSKGNRLTAGSRTAL